MKIRFLYLFMALFAMTLFYGCTEKESNIGLDLQDPSTIYHGNVDTAYGIAYSVYDDSLLTTGLNAAIIGSWYEPHFGTSTATLFANVSTPDGASVSFDDHCTIDSVVLSLAITGMFFPASDTASSQDLHFKILQLSQRLNKDSAYYSDSEVGVGTTVFYDDVVSLERGDSMVVSLKLTPAFAALIENKNYSSSDEFEDAVKGFHISLDNSTGHYMAAINLAASATRLTVYYTYTSGGQGLYRTYDFAFGSNVPHFSHFSKNFIESLSTFNSNKQDSVRTLGQLYLCPLGGTNIKFNVDSFVRQFHKDHPLAIIHYAELVMPVSVETTTGHPESIAALKRFANGLVANIPDMYDIFTYSGFDGTYDSAKKCYRMRVTQHFQNLVREGRDYGTLLVISGRRTSMEHAIVNGDNVADPIRIEFVYSE